MHQGCGKWPGTLLKHLLGSSGADLEVTALQGAVMVHQTGAPGTGVPCWFAQLDGQGPVSMSRMTTQGRRGTPQPQPARPPRMASQAPSPGSCTPGLLSFPCW